MNPAVSAFRAGEVVEVKWGEEGGERGGQKEPYGGQRSKL